MFKALTSLRYLKLYISVTEMANSSKLICDKRLLVSSVYANNQVGSQSFVVVTAYKISTHITSNMVFFMIKSEVHLFYAYSYHHHCLSPCGFCFGVDYIWILNYSLEVLRSLVVSKFGISSQAVTSVWLRVLQVAMLRTCPNMTLSVD